MANKIVLKKSSVAAKVPVAGDLDVGELAVNLVDQKLYSKNASGIVVLVGQGAAAGGEFAAGTAMMFVQTAAPTGWTKSTTHDNKALRVVSGTASSGGTTAFSTVFANQTPTITTSGLSAGATTLTTAQLASHTHVTNIYRGSGGGVFEDLFIGTNNFVNTYVNTQASGGGGSHTHTVSGTATSSAVTLNVQYVDVIIATKN